MITGSVSASRQATIRLLVRGPSGQEQEIVAVIDTGFTGFLTLPPALVAALGLIRRGRGRAILADGSIGLLDVYAATAMRDGQSRRIPAHAARSDPLVGMSLLYGWEVRIQARDGGSVIIEAIP